jgi:hypothetical protein
VIGSETGPFTDVDEFARYGPSALSRAVQRRVHSEADKESAGAAREGTGVGEALGGGKRPAVTITINGLSSKVEQA